MNFKKFISGVSALTIAASAFAGMAVTANAESSVFNEDFSGSTYNVSWGGTSAGGVTPAVADGVLKVANGSATGDRSAYVSFGDNAVSGNAHIRFDMAMTKSNWGGKNNYFYLLPAYSNARYPATENAVMKLTQDSNGAITESNTNTAIGTYDGITLTYDLTLVGGSATLNVYNGATKLNQKPITYTTTGTGINTMNLQFNKNNGAFAIDNIELKRLSVPTLALDESSVAINTGASTTVNGTVTKGTETDSVETTASSDNAAVTATVTDGNTTSPVINIASTGTVATTAKITVTTATTGANANAAEVTTQTIDVTVGAVKYADVMVNYVDGSGNVLKTADTVSGQTVGLTYNATEEQKADIADVTIDGIHYYCTLNTSSATSVAVAEGGSVLDLVFDKTEYTYDATVTTNPNTTVSITGASTTGTQVDVSPVSNYAGVATAKLPAGTYTVNVSKTDYTSASGELVIANGGANSASVVLSPVDGVIYSQTFDKDHTALLNTGNQRYNNNKYQMYNYTGVAPFGTVENSYDRYIVTAPGVSFYANNANFAQRSASIAVMNGDTVIASISAKYTGHIKDDGGTILDATELTVGTTTTSVAAWGDLTITLDTTKDTDNLTIVYGGDTYTYTTDAESLTGIRFSAGNQLYTSVSSIRVTGENIPDAPTSTFEAAEWASTDADWAADGNKLTDKYENSVYGYKTEITGNAGYTYTVKGYIESSESDGKTTLTLGKITNASPMVFYLITDEMLNLTNSRVYGVAE